MNATEFILDLVQVVHQGAVEDVLATLERSPGRRPTQKSQEASQWYGSLSSTDREKVKAIVEQSVHAALFGALCVLDGVRAVSASEKHEFHLLSVESERDSQRLNAPEAEALHDLYQSQVYERVFL